MAAALRVLVTGASGLVGRRAVAAMKRAGHTIIATRRTEVDLLQPGAFGATLDGARPDVLVHLAWSASGTRDYRRSPENDRWRQATVTAAADAIDRGIRFIGTGTGLDDDAVDDAYSMAKAAVRAELAPAIEARQITWLRPFYVFDEEAPSPAVLRAILEAKHARRAVRLATPGARHDFVHAIDVGAAIGVAVDADLTGVVDVGAGTARSVSDLASAFGVEWESGAANQEVPGTSAVADTTLLTAAGWLPAATDARFAAQAGRR